MSISNGVDANATNFNNAFASKSANNTLTGIQDLNNGSSGAQVSNAQQAINTNITNIATNTSNISTNTTNISTNSTNISTLQTQITQAPVWTKVTKAYSDLSTAATTNDIELLSLAAGDVIHGVVIRHTTAFSGGSISAYDVSVGITGSANKYSLDFDVFQATGDQVFESAQTLGPEDFGSATSIRLFATSTGDNLDQATAGSVDVYILKSSLP